MLLGSVGMKWESSRTRCLTRKRAAPSLNFEVMCTYTEGRKNEICQRALLATSLWHNPVQDQEISSAESIVHLSCSKKYFIWITWYEVTSFGPHLVAFLFQLKPDIVKIEPLRQPVCRSVLTSLYNGIDDPQSPFCERFANIVQPIRGIWVQARILYKKRKLH
jgi:hypothetical protein